MLVVKRIESVIKITQRIQVIIRMSTALFDTSKKAPYTIENILNR